ncbi:hypothetical protein TNCT_169761 [Trichonephila clavata]|uniref:Uncharacterized protein n=1 Tax=Trichonephila clavata TaxID=2740835 RepID=A0A8X6LJI7_TRICU|nr:hypothetical protein TNCT_169761 [Trichonephila clavata]
MAYNKDSSFNRKNVPSGSKTHPRNKTLDGFINCDIPLRKKKRTKPRRVDTSNRPLIYYTEKRYLSKLIFRVAKNKLSDKGSFNATSVTSRNEANKTA